MTDTQKLEVDPMTQASDAVDARQEPGADREPTPEEEAAAERAAPVDPDVAETYAEQNERGADLEGEGRIEVADDGIPPAPAQG